MYKHPNLCPLLNYVCWSTELRLPKFNLILFYHLVLSIFILLLFNSLWDFLSASLWRSCEYMRQFWSCLFMKCCNDRILVAMHAAGRWSFQSPRGYLCIQEQEIRVGNLLKNLPVICKKSTGPHQNSPVWQNNDLSLLKFVNFCFSWLIRVNESNGWNLDIFTRELPTKTL